jgi:hypothetical protein
LLQKVTICNIMSIKYALKSSKKFNIPRIVLQRDDQGNLIYNINDLNDSIVILNTTSNIDGRELLKL